MTREELFELLEIDTSEDFQYFEQFAELVECEDEIEYDDFYEVIFGADADTLAEINENYFTEIEKSFPEDCDDFYEVMQSIWSNLIDLLKNASDETCRREYVNQLYKFHEMYTAPDGASVDGRPCSVMEAIAENRMSAIDHEKHKFDFENCLDYVPDYISMRLGGFEEDEEYSDDTM